MNTLRMRASVAAFSGMAVAVAAGVAQAAPTVTAVFGAPLLRTVNYSLNLPGFTGARSDPTSIIVGDRLDSPGPGVDATLPDPFFGFCIELGPAVVVVDTYEVFATPGSTTNTGGFSGPVTLDAVKTRDLARLFGGFFTSIVDNNTSAAFQLAVWEIAFDTDRTLNDPTGLTPLYVAPGQFQMGVTDVAENWLSVVRSATVLPESTLSLLVNADNQDIIVPAPGAGALALAGLGLAARRRRR